MSVFRSIGGFLLCVSVFLEPFDAYANPLKTNSNELFHPFRYAGLRIEELPSEELPSRNSLKKGYGEAIIKYPDAASCLEGGKMPEDSSTNIAVRWSDLSDEYSQAVCLFRIGDSFRSVENFRTWLKSEGYILYNVGIWPNRSKLPAADDRLVCGFSAVLPRREYEMRFGAKRFSVRILEKIFGRENAGFSNTFHFSCGGRSILVDLTQNYL